MIYIPIARSLNMAKRIKKSNPTKKQIKRANNALFLGKTHMNNMVRPVIHALQPWSSPLPLDMNVPLLPYI
jgi:hypothetical protein